MSKGSERVLTPQTRTRLATHSPASAIGQQCPACGSHHVLTTVSCNGRRLGAFWCALCERFFTP